MGGICAELNPAEIIVMWCDAAITREYRDVLPEDMEGLFKEWKTKGVGGGGGTDFRPPFARVEELGIFPDMMVYFTDTYGTFPQEPRYPVIWGVTTDRDPPWGEVVRITIGPND
jgi:predicted metal-dependent peptidase